MVRVRGYRVRVRVPPLQIDPVLQSNCSLLFKALAKSHW